MSMIEIRNLTFAYEGSYDNVFENVSFRLDTDWKLGFTGRNGRGKTTFLRLLMGELDSGGAIFSPVPFDYFPFPVHHPEELALEVVHYHSPAAEDWEILREASLLHVDAEALYRPFCTLSNGEQTKLLLAGLFLKEGNFLLIDEPTNHLDLEGRETVAAYLQKKKGFILVSHDRAFLDGCIDHVLSINKADIVVRRGNFSAWLEDKEQQDRLELAKYERLKGEIKRLEVSSRRTAAWSEKVEKSKIGAADKGYVGHMAAKMMKRSMVTQARKEKAIEEKSGLLKNLELEEALKIHPLEHPSLRLAEFHNASASWNGKAVSEPVSFTIERGDRIALTGRNGCGKSSLLKLLIPDAAVERVPYMGEVHIVGNLKISYVPQDPSFLKGTLAEFEESRKIDVPLFRAILRKMDFSRVQFEKDMASYSAGQKKKVLLAASLSESAHLYIWDEPLNYVDILSRIQLEELLGTYKPTLLLVEHDRHFVETIATKTVHVEKAGG